MLAVPLVTVATVVHLLGAAADDDGLQHRLAEAERALQPRLIITGRRSRFTLGERMQHHHAPAVSLAVIDGVRVVAARAYGVREAGRPEPVDTETLFQAASVSKPVAAMVALAAVAQGVLALDEDVAARLRSWRIPDSDFLRERPITLRALGTHSSGLAPISGAHFSPAQPVPTLVQVLAGLPPAKLPAAHLTAAPGTRAVYANSNFNVIQLLLTDVTGTPFPALARMLVLAPLGLEHSFFEQPLPVERQGNVASPHGEDGRPIAGKWDLRPEMASGGLRTTPSDLARFLVAVLRARRGDAGFVVPRALARLMTTPLVQDRSFGFAVTGRGRQLRLDHGGSNDGYKCRVVLFPATGQGAVVMATGEHGARRLLDEILRGLGSAYRWPRSDLAPVERRVVKVDPAVLAGYAGRYEVLGEAVVTHEAGRLFIQPPESPRDELLASARAEFFLAEEDVRFSFGKDATGAATLTAHFPDGTRATGRRLEK